MIGASLRTVASDGVRSAGTGPPGVRGRPDGEASVPDDDGAAEPTVRGGVWPGEPNGSAGRAFGLSGTWATVCGREASAAEPTPTARRAMTTLAVPARASVRRTRRPTNRPLRIGSSIQRWLAAATRSEGPATAEPAGGDSGASMAAAGRTRTGQGHRYSEYEIRPR